MQIDINNNANLADKLAFVSRTILVVDDEPSVAKIIQRMIEKEGHKVVLASNGFEALDTFETHNIDLVITDLKMPGMDGVELIKQIRKIDNELEIIVITGYGTMEIFMQAVRAGANDMILKPIDNQQFLRSVSRSLEKKKLVDGLLAKTQQLVQSEKMATIGLLSTGIAHEINNPTTFIRSNLQLLKEYIKRLTPRLDDLNDPRNQETLKNILVNEFPKMIEEALRGTDRIKDIVAGVKHYSHMGDDSQEDKVDIRQVIKQAVNLVRTNIRKDIKITENYLNVREIKGQFSKLEQVFVNLLVNAADAIEDRLKRLRKEGDKETKGFIDVSASVFEGDEVDGETTDDLVLTFYDNGNGIPKHKIKRVFDPFYTSKAVGVGTGLGLYICYEIIKQHGGAVTVQSEEGEGTAFIIKLPVEGVGGKVEKKEETD